MVQKTPTLINPYSICVIDIGSPKLGNIGWCLKNTAQNTTQTGEVLDELFDPLAQCLSSQGIILGLEAPLFVPLREDLILATKGRKGEGKRPWSAGAGAQVLAINLPVMIYIFQGIKNRYPEAEFFLNDSHYEAKSGQVMIFEALVSGSDKGASHMEDAKIMAEYCAKFSSTQTLAPTLLEEESGVSFFNLAAAALLRLAFIEDTTALSVPSPIYKPT